MQIVKNKSITSTRPMTATELLVKRREFLEKIYWDIMRKCYIYGDSYAEIRE